MGKKNYNDEGKKSSKYALKMKKRNVYARKNGFPVGTPFPMMGITDSRHDGISKSTQKRLAICRKSKQNNSGGA